MVENFEPGFNQEENEAGRLEARLRVEDEMLERIPGRVGRWFDEFCSGHAVNSRNRVVNRIGYFVVEFAKNTVEHGGGGEVGVKILDDSIEATFRDAGPGFENPIEDIEVSTGQGFGLKEAMKYADDFTIETGGRKFTREITKSRRKRLVDAGPSEITEGSKVIFVKRFRTPRSK